jgi:hypothetical protein
MNSVESTARSKKAYNLGMSEVGKALLTLLYAFLNMVFIFLTILSFAVLFGLVSQADSAPYVGLLCVVVFWIAASKYRKKFLERVAEVQKKSEHHDDDDERPDAD